MVTNELVDMALSGFPRKYSYTKLGQISEATTLNLQLNKEKKKKTENKTKR